MTPKPSELPARWREDAKRAGESPMSTLNQCASELAASLAAHTPTTTDTQAAREALGRLVSNVKEVAEFFEWGRLYAADRDTLSAALEAHDRLSARVVELEAVVRETAQLIDDDCLDIGAYVDGHCSLAEAVRSELEASLAAHQVSGWRDIATAPKVMPGALVLMEEDLEDPEESLVTIGRWVGSWWEMDNGTAFEPTHWSPLPGATDPLATEVERLREELSTAQTDRVDETNQLRSQVATLELAAKHDKQLIEDWESRGLESLQERGELKERVAELESEVRLAWSDEHDPLKEENKELRAALTKGNP